MAVRDRKSAKYERLLIDATRESARRRVTVGIHEEEGAQTDGELTVAEIGSIHEFGAPEAGIPQRSFIRDWYDENQARVSQVLAELLQNNDQKEALKQFALWAEADVKDRINNGIAPPLSAETIRRKGSSLPLVDKGILRASIRAKVE